VTAKATWSGLAELDLEEIVYYIAVKDGRPHVAEQIAREIREACDRYAQHPHLGVADARLGENVRRFTHKRWVIFYRPLADSIGVLRVIDSSRDFDRLFSSG
jgi:plasmid stabilization system protein ParE